MRHPKELEPNQISESTKASMKTRIIAGLTALAICLPFFILGDWFLFAFSAFILIVAMTEIINVVKKDYSLLLYIVTFVVGALMTYWPVIISLINYKNGASTDWSDLIHFYDYFQSIEISVPAIFIGASLLFLTVVLHDSFTVRDACFLIAMVIIITVGLQSIIYCRMLPSIIYEKANPGQPFWNYPHNIESWTLLVYVCIAAFMTDTGAYFTGVLFGKTKINERISPKKTYGGFVGGLVISALCSGGFAFIMSAVGKSVLPGLLDTAHWWNIIILSVLMPIFATLGDFVFSAIKRSYDIKDYGKIIPGHGGILDRLDSMIFTFLTAGVYLYIYYIVVGA